MVVKPIIKFFRNDLFSKSTYIYDSRLFSFSKFLGDLKQEKSIKAENILFIGRVTKDKER